MNDRTLVFLTNKEKVLLAMKKRGFGKGKWNGYGGKLEKGETIKQAAVRELFEESGINVKEQDLQPKGIVSFKFLDKPEWSQDVYIFIIEEIKEAIETEEMKPQLFEKNKLPLTEMWDGDNQWLPLVLEKKEVKATMEFKGEGEFTKIIFEKPFKKIIEK